MSWDAGDTAQDLRDAWAELRTLPLGGRGHLADICSEGAAEIDALRAENERLHTREAHFAKVLGVTDGGQYRNDWDAKLTGLRAENERLREAARVLIGAYMGGDDKTLADAINALEVAGGFRQQGGGQHG